MAVNSRVIKMTGKFYSWVILGSKLVLARIEGVETQHEEPVRKGLRSFSHSQLSCVVAPFLDHLGAQGMEPFLWNSTGPLLENFLQLPRRGIAAKASSELGSLFQSAEEASTSRASHFPFHNNVLFYWSSSLAFFSYQILPAFHMTNCRGQSCIV